MPQPDPTPVSPDQIERLVAARRATKTSLAEALELTGANTISEMSPSQFIRAMSWLRQKRRRLENAHPEA